jgi:catechol 2,3-dioxygenase-like lactoylglutathione lyase family enzyme
MPIRHVTIRVKSVSRARRFYDRVMSLLGYSLGEAEGDFAGYFGGKDSVWLWQVRGKTRPKRSEPGIDHVAFNAQSRAAVDAMQRLLRKNRFRILYPAEDHPEFVPGYYSVSFRDPDGNILELVHLPPRRRK